MEAGKRAGKAERDLKVVPPAWPVERIEVSARRVCHPRRARTPKMGFPHIAGSRAFRGTSVSPC